MKNHQPTMFPKIEETEEAPWSKPKIIRPGRRDLDVVEMYAENVFIVSGPVLKIFLRKLNRTFYSLEAFALAVSTNCNAQIPVLRKLCRKFLQSRVQSSLHP